jgi:hypothetical protein
MFAIFVKIKKGGGSYAPSLSTQGFVVPIYIEAPNLFSSNGIYSFTRKDFAKSMTYATKV